MLYYRADYGRFMSSGFTAEFMTLPSRVWEWDTAQELAIVAANAADAGAVVTLDELQTDGVSVVRSVVAASVAGTAAGTTDQLDSFIKPATQGVLSLNSTTYNNPATVVVNGVVCYTQFTISGTLIADGDYVWDVGSSTWIPTNGTALANNASVHVYQFGGWAIDSHPNGNFESLIGQNTTVPPYDASQAWIGLGWTGGGGTKPPVFTIPKIPAYQQIISLQPSDLSAPKCQRIQLVGKPTTTGQNSRHLHVLGKRVTPAFAAETDTPGINGLDGVLAALACYDFRLYRDEGGPGDASAALTEAVGPQFLTTGKPGGFLGKLIEEEVIQAAYNCRIIPDHGFGGGGYFDQPFQSKGNPYG
jgi:hypothetical protein